MASSPAEQDGPKTFPWDTLLSNRGLSHLVTDIFLRVDVDTFCNLERVCRAWRDHIMANGLWKERLVAAAGAGEYSEAMVSQILGLDLSGRDLRDLCRSVCLNRLWMGGGSVNIAHWENAAPFPVEDFGLIGHDTIVATKWENVYEEQLREEQGGRADVPIPEEQKTFSVMRCSRESSELETLHYDGTGPALILNLGLRGEERVACFDVLGDRAAVATTEGTLGIWHWKWALCLNGVVKSSPPASCIKFHPGGKHMVSAHAKANRVSVWSCRKGYLELLQTIPCPATLTAVSLSAHHMVLIGTSSLGFYSRDQTMGTYANIGGHAAPDDVNLNYAASLDSCFGVAVTCDLGTSTASIKVWEMAAAEGGVKMVQDLDRLGQGRPGPMAECAHSGILVVCHSELGMGGERGTFGVLIIPTKGLRHGLQFAAFVDLFDAQPRVDRILAEGLGNRALLRVIRAAEDGRKFFLLAGSFLKPRRQRLFVLDPEATEGSGSVLAKTIVNLK